MLGGVREQITDLRNVTMPDIYKTSHFTPMPTAVAFTVVRRHINASSANWHICALE